MRIQLLSSMLSVAVLVFSSSSSSFLLRLLDVLFLCGFRFLFVHFYELNATPRIWDRKVCLWKFSVCQLIFAAFVFSFSLSFSLSLSCFVCVCVLLIVSPDSIPLHARSRTLFFFLLSVSNFFCLSHSESIGWTIFIKSLLFIWVFACKMSWLWWGLLSLYSIYGRYAKRDTWTLLLLSSDASSSSLLLLVFFLSLVLFSLCIFFFFSFTVPPRRIRIVWIIRVFVSFLCRWVDGRD